MSAYLACQHYSPPIQKRVVINTSTIGKPIISYGLAVQAANSNRYILVQRKNSVEFILILQGNFRPSHLPVFIPLLSTTEADILINILDNEAYYINIMHTLGLKYEPDSYEYILKNKYGIENLIYHVKPCALLEWTIPKGRSANGEDGHSCAIREFKEETELDIELGEPCGYYINRYMTIAGRLIETRYWKHVIEHEIELPPVDPNDVEVGGRKWVNEEEFNSLMS